MKKINIGSNIKIYWKIWRGANKVSEDFNSMNTNLKVFLVGSGDTYYLEPSINNTIDPGYDIIELDIPALRLGVGVYNIKAIWEKNGGRNVLTSARASVLYLTDSPSEAPIQDEEVRIVSLVESFGRDGMSPYESAIMRGIGIGSLSEKEWLMQFSQHVVDKIAEAEREESESIRNKNEEHRANAELSRVNSEKARVDAENARVKSESTRVDVEDNRKDAELKRANAEAARKVMEDKRIASESSRINNESERIKSENSRRKAEASRALAEENREKTFIKSEESREDVFSNNEAKRENRVPILRLGNGNILEVSYDQGESWKSLSDPFVSRFFIKQYVEDTSQLPAEELDGTIYAVKSKNFDNANPAYDIYVKGITGWVNNGKLTGVGIGLVQSLGNSETEAMSQRAVTKEIEQLRRVFDGGRADSQYGGARIINCGGANR